jgi:hypothetical protein
MQYETAMMLTLMRDLPGLQLGDNRSDFISSGHHPVGSFFWIDTSE